MQSESVSELVEPFVEQGVRLLKQFHDEFAKSPVNRDTEFARGALAAWRDAVSLVYGRKSSALLERVRQATQLGFPHCGPLAPDGESYLGWDSEAALVL